MAGVVLASTPTFACGFHDPRSVARGVMNLAYPKSLYVGTAVWQAQRTGVLPPRPRKASKDLFAYQRTVSNMQNLGARLATPDGAAEPFTVVLLSAMLWTRFKPGHDGYDATVHVKGPERGDAVLVTEPEVIKALLDGALDIEQAETHGLFRLYGPGDRQAEVRKALRGLSSVRAAASLGKPN
jgi:hypothetical protein